MNAATHKTPGQTRYERDVRFYPYYPGGFPRRAWDELPEYARWSWEQNAAAVAAGNCAPLGQQP